jgi:hypothetical protein
MVVRALLSGLLLGLPSILFAQTPEIAWQAPLGGSDWDQSFDIAPINSGGYWVVGFSESNDGDVSGNHGAADGWLARLDTNGTLSWQVCLGGSAGEQLHAVASTQDGGAVLVGYSHSSDGDLPMNLGQQDVWIVKVDASGTIAWQAVLGGSFSDEAQDVALTDDGGYIIAGYTKSSDGDVQGFHTSAPLASDAWLVKLDASGNLVWQRALGGSGDDRAWAVQQTSDGGYIVGGDSFSNDGDISGNHGSMDAWVVKLTGAGVIEWQRALGGTGFDQAFDLQQLPNGEYLLAGSSNSSNGDISVNHGGTDFWLMRVDANGDMVWESTYGGTGNDSARGIEGASDGSVIVCGVSLSADGDLEANNGLMDCWVLKVDSLGGVLWQRNLGGSDLDIAQDVLSKNEGGVLVVGWTYSDDIDVFGHHGTAGIADCWVVELGSTTGEVEVSNPQQGNFSVGPIPAVNQLFITTDQSLLPAGLTVMDILGRTLTNITFTGPKHIIDVSSFPRGLYLVSLRSAYTHQAWRVLLE